MVPARILALCCVAVAAGCPAGPGERDAGGPGASVVDAGRTVGADAGGADAGAEPLRDAGPRDAGRGSDAGDVLDAGERPPDASVVDDAGPFDAAAGLDAGAVDAALAVDASLPDAGAPDAGPGCAPRFIPGPGCPGHDAALAAKAHQYERAFHVVAAAPYHATTDVVVTDPAARARLDDFLTNDTGWDYAGYTGVALGDDVLLWQKTAGLYAGAGIAADAYRYAVLRDEGAPVAEVDRARAHLLDGLEALHLAKTIPNTPGVIARGVVRTDIASLTVDLVPLFDQNGDPLPADKNNGTWRADNSGLYPNHAWEDSVSRDQYIGWVAAYGAAWEVVQSDPSIPSLYKDRLQTEAADLGQALMQTTLFGYDLEIPDADGRTTYHGYLHEEAYDRTYIPFLPIKNAANAIMALGIVSTLAWVSGDAALTTYLLDELIAARDLPGIIETDMQVDLGPSNTNFSSYNMVFMGAWLASRTLPDAAARASVRAALDSDIYAKPNPLLAPNPTAWGQSLYDFIYAAAQADASAGGPGTLPVDDAAIQRGVATLAAFDAPPLFSDEVLNCDPTEEAAGSCVAIDGTTTITVRAEKDRFDEIQAEAVVPLPVRPRSNYEWRSNPFRINGPAAPVMVSGVDFRYAYWMGRYLPR